MEILSHAKALLQQAQAQSDEAEVFTIWEAKDEVSYENGRLKEIDSSIQCGAALRVIKGGKLGFAYAKNPDEPEALLRGALASLQGGAEAPPGFAGPPAAPLPSLDTVDADLEGVPTDAIVAECDRVVGWLKERVAGQVNINATRMVTRFGVLTSGGAELEGGATVYALSPQVLLPGSHAAVYRTFDAKGFAPTPEALLEHVARLYRATEQPAPPKPGRQQVLFLPESVYVLAWRLSAATSGQEVYEKASPVAERVGEQVLDGRITFYDDPLDDTVPGARAFDDEGTPTARLALYDKGVLRGFYADRLYAGKLGMAPTGHGHKATRWGGETVAIQPSPSLEHLVIAPGQVALDDMIGSMERGVIVVQPLGAHSGNIPNGDFSIGLSVGLTVENGEIRGLAKGAMVSGNVYETLGRVVAVGDRLSPASFGRFPAVLVDGVSVAAKDT